MNKIEAIQTTARVTPGQSGPEVVRDREALAPAHERAQTDAAVHAQRRAAALDRLCSAALSSTRLDEVLQKLIELFVEVGRAEVGVLRLREEDRLRTRASVGVEEELAIGFSTPLSVDAAGSPLNGHLSTFARQRDETGPTDAFVLLKDAEVIGAVVLGFPADRPLSEDDRQLLSSLAPHAAAAIHRAQGEDALRAAVNARDEVLSVVAHDLKNPVNVIAISANALLHRAEEPTTRRPLERILRAVNRAERLLRDLLEINAIEAGRLSLEKCRVEPADLILAALESQQSVAEDSSVIIKSDLAPELPAVDADEERLLEVFENLIGNAVKFTGAGGSVTVGASRQGDEIVFVIEDNGPGIPPEELPHVFDRFWHAKKAKRRGTGLGLTICKGIVEAHGGRLWLESTPGEGTKARFTLSISAATAERPEPIDVVNILLVDDRPENLMSLKSILERPDYRVLTATSGEEALALALREKFALALIDIAMPGMNGLEVATNLKALERSRDIPIIFITAFGNDPQEIHKAYAAGGADYLVKPLDPDIVRKKVAVFVDLSRRRLGNNARSPQS